MLPKSEAQSPNWEAQRYNSLGSGNRDIGTCLTFRVSLGVRCLGFGVRGLGFRASQPQERFINPKIPRVTELEVFALRPFGSSATHMLVCPSDPNLSTEFRLRGF